jgi:hypothetical protein
LTGIQTKDTNGNGDGQFEIISGSSERFGSRIPVRSPQGLSYKKHKKEHNQKEYN